jgi:hypothetical protein
MDGNRKRAQFLLDQRVLRDSNFYAPRDTGDLIRSGIIATGGGEVKWDTVYARVQYYNYPNKSKDLNPFASPKWFEVAKAKHKNEWIEAAQREYS